LESTVEPFGKNTLGALDYGDRGANFFVCIVYLAQSTVIMAFLLVVVVDNAQLNEQFFFRSIDRCNFFAYMIESGKYRIVQNNRMSSQQNITAYCIPKYAAPNTNFWD
jgi:hypothetical protein